MISASWGTGFVCPICGKEGEFTISDLAEGVSGAWFMDKVAERLNREGGTLKTGACEHKFYVEPGSRRYPSNPPSFFGEKFKALSSWFKNNKA